MQLTEMKKFQMSACVGTVVYLLLFSGCATSKSDSEFPRKFEPGQVVMYVVDCDPGEKMIVPDYGAICPQVEFVDNDSRRQFCSQLDNAERAYLEERQFCTDLEETSVPDPWLGEVICVDCIYDSPEFMTWVQVLAVRGDRVLFRSRYGGFHHTPFEGWVDEEYLVPGDRFMHIDGWPEEILYIEVCLEDEGCREVSNFRNNRLKVAFVFDYDATCPFERDNSGYCETDGFALTFRQYLYFTTDLDSNPSTNYRELQIPFLVQQDGRLCWAPAWQHHKICMPLNAEYYDPTTAE